MIAALFIAPILAAVTPAVSTLPELKPAVVLQRYAAALAKIKEPRTMTFLYTLDQTGVKTLAQTHRVYRAGDDERDELLSVDGHALAPPKVRIFRGRRNRYAIRMLAPRPADYDFAFVGPRRNAHHFDYVFRLTAKTPRQFAVTDVTLDGVRFLPSAIAFETAAAGGSGSITFGVNATWWVPYTASARATIGESLAAEKLSFYTYRFPPTFPPSTFGRARGAVKPAAPLRTLPGRVILPGANLAPPATPAPRRTLPPAVFPAEPTRGSATP